MFIMVMPDSIIRRLPLYRRRTLVYTVLFLGLVTGIVICTFGDSLMFVKQSVDTQRLIQYGGHSFLGASPVSTDVGRGTKSFTRYLKVGNVKRVLGLSAFNGSDTDVYFKTTHRSVTTVSGLRGTNIPPFKTQTSVNNGQLGGAQWARNLFHNIKNVKASSNDSSSDGMGTRVTLVSSFPGSEYPLVKNNGLMGIVTTLHGDNRMMPTSATRFVSITTRSFNLPLKEVNQQTNSVDKNIKESKNFTSIKYYQTNLPDTSFYDNQIKVVMETRDACADAGSYDAVMTVHSAPSNAQKRLAFRWLYVDPDKTHPYKIKVIFLVGLVNNQTLQTQLVQENNLYNDIVQGNFLDTYHNLTFKAVFGFYWVATRCKALRLLLRLDDDVFVAIDRFFYTWNLTKNNSTKSVLCEVHKNEVVRRKGKWGVPETLLADPKYVLPYCLGYFAAITPQLAHEVSEVSRRTPFFWIDDVFIYGFVMSKITGVNFISSNQWTLRAKFAHFEKCLLVKGPHGCPWWSVIAEPNSVKKLYSLLYNATIGNHGFTPLHPQL